jgi:hypothetical protein
MTGSDLITLTASIASLVLAVLAIWLSVVFYKLTSKLSGDASEAAKDIGSSVDRLEKLFDKLYADTFSMMRDTVSDMRKHIWPDQTSEAARPDVEAAKRADERIAQLKQAFSQELGTVLQKQRITDERLSAVRGEMSQLLDRAISSSRRVDVEALEEALRSAIVSSLHNRHGDPRPLTADALLGKLESDFPSDRIIEEVSKMLKEGIILASPTGSLKSSTILTLGGEAPGSKPGPRR